MGERFHSKRLPSVGARLDRAIGGILLLLLVLHAPPVDGASVADSYFEAEACYGVLQKNARKAEFRDNWLQCIDKFQSVYRQDPTGPWAPAGLYMSGKLYRELAGRSGREADRREAVDIFQRLVNKFPDSRYHDRAADELQALRAERKPASTPPSTAAEMAPAPPDHAEAKAAYLQAEACYRDLRTSNRKVRYRHNWMRCINRFEKVYRVEPEGPWAAAGLYMVGRLYEELHRWSKSPADQASAREAYEKIVSDFPDSRYMPKASTRLGSLPSGPAHAAAGRPKPPGTSEDESEAVLTKTPPAESASAAPAGKAVVTGLRYWSNPNYTRVVIDADRESDYTHHLLKKDPALNKPQRLYVDVGRSRLGGDLQKTIPINDDLLINARAGQYTTDSVRVVVDIKSFETYKIFSLKDPFRIVIDVWGTADKTLAKTPSGPGAGPKEGVSTGALAKQLALGVRRIVIDPGHGGQDFGAPGAIRGVHEKQVVLQIARRLARLLEKELRCEVILTRDGDRYLTLEERTAFANTRSADLFISIHTNASRDPRAYGIETYFLNLATDEEAIRVAAMENATSTKNISDLQTILNDLMQNAKINESSRLAGHVQASIVRHLKSRGYSRIKDKGVKQAPFYVLLGARMPSILIETSFISNTRENKRLVDPNYQQRMCEAITMGIRAYIKEIHPTALRRPPAGEASNG
jgi:N-acetylmuramoyl-L-alanine amidase